MKEEASQGIASCLVPFSGETLGIGIPGVMKRRGYTRAKTRLTGAAGVLFQRKRLEV